MVGVDSCWAVVWPRGDELRRAKSHRKNVIIFKGMDFFDNFSGESWAPWADDMTFNLICSFLCFITGS